MEVKNGEGWKRTYIRTGLSDGIHIGGDRMGSAMETELKGAMKMEEDEVK